MLEVNPLDVIPKNRLFAVEFTKKDGVPRSMVARRHFIPFHNGAVDPVTDWNLLPVRDMQLARMGEESFRFVPLDRIKSVKVNGKTYVINA